MDITQKKLNHVFHRTIRSNNRIQLADQIQLAEKPLMIQTENYQDWRFLGFAI